MQLRIIGGNFEIGCGIEGQFRSSVETKIRGLQTSNCVVARVFVFQMELPLQSLSSPSFSNITGDLKLKVHQRLYSKSFSLIDIKPQEQRRKLSMGSSALPETAASVAIAATVVGAAATLLVRRRVGSEATEIPTKICEDCGGSGICSECNGEGFVLKKLSEESAERARLTAKNAATRYTAGLPKKWSYCAKCSSTRSCSTCGGRGKLSL